MAPGQEDGGQPSGDNNGLETSAGAAEETRLDPGQDEPTTNADSAPGPPNPVVSARIREGQLHRLLNHVDPPSLGADLSGPALTDEDDQLLRAFNKALEEDIMEYCSRCHEKWFGMSLREGICTRCINRDKDRQDGQPFLMSRENHSLVPEAPTHLPALTDVEEILIARIKVAIQVWLVKGAQWKYTGHVVNFMRDTGKIYRKLPTLPKDADIVLIRPARGPDGSRAQFQKRLTVRRHVVQLWLEYLKHNHPGYSDIDIDHDALAQLPHDGTVDDRVQREEYEPVTEDLHEPPPADDELEPDINFAAVPNVNADGNVTRQLAELLHTQHQQSGRGNAPEVDVMTTGRHMNT